MANTYFNFKQFQVLQEHAAMRVTTDACLFGAWIQLHEAKQVLDVGTGTGLLSLMLAQRFPEVLLTAVELELGACIDAARNFSNSRWKERLHLVQNDVRRWLPEQRFDAIVSNPPFFIRDLPNPGAARKLARHGQDGLSLEVLLGSVDRLLHPEGTFHVMLPPPVMLELEHAAQPYGFLIRRLCRVQHRADKPAHLAFAAFSRDGRQVMAVEQFVLKDADAYSPQAREYLSPFYLYLDDMDSA